PADTQPFLVSAIPVEGNEEKIPAQDEMQKADDRKKSEAFPNLERRDQQNISDQHLFDLFIALGGAAQEQNCGSRRNDVSDTDDRFLGNLTCPFACDGKNRGPHKGKAKSDGKGRRALKVQMEQDRDADSHRGHLSHCDIDENNAALDDVETQIDE